MARCWQGVEIGIAFSVKKPYFKYIEFRFLRDELKGKQRIAIPH
jgi:hypothetical protein